MLAYTAYNFDFIRWGYGTTPFDEKRVKRLRKMAMYTTCDVEVRMGLSELAAELGISPQHLSFDIKEKFGKTFQELLCYSKCEKAAKLLMSTDRHIVDIAAECGFSDNKYQVKYFKHFFQVTPNEFRRVHKTNEIVLAKSIRYKDLPLHNALDLLQHCDERKYLDN